MLIIYTVILILVAAFLFYWPIMSIPRYKKYWSDYEEKQKQQQKDLQQNQAYLLEKKIAEKYRRSSQQRTEQKSTVVYKERSITPYVLSFVATIAGTVISVYNSIKADTDGKFIIYILFTSISLAVFIAETKVEHRIFKDK